MEKGRCSGNRGVDPARELGVVPPHEAEGVFLLSRSPLAALACRYRQWRKAPELLAESADM
jgi:hypothetical protein